MGNLRNFLMFLAVIKLCVPERQWENATFLSDLTTIQNLVDQQKEEDIKLVQNLQQELPTTTVPFSLSSLQQVRTSANLAGKQGKPESVRKHNKAIKEHFGKVEIKHIPNRNVTAPVGKLMSASSARSSSFSTDSNSNKLNAKSSSGIPLLNSISRLPIAEDVTRGIRNSEYNTLNRTVSSNNAIDHKHAFSDTVSSLQTASGNVAKNQIATNAEGSAEPTSTSNSRKIESKLGHDEASLKNWLREEPAWSNLGSNSSQSNGESIDLQRQKATFEKFILKIYNATKTLDDSMLKNINRNSSVPEGIVAKEWFSTNMSEGENLDGFAWDMNQFSLANPKRNSTSTKYDKHIKSIADAQANYDLAWLKEAGDEVLPLNESADVQFDNAWLEPHNDTTFTTNTSEINSTADSEFRYLSLIQRIVDEMENLDAEEQNETKVNNSLTETSAPDMQFGKQWFDGENGTMKTWETARINSSTERLMKEPGLETNVQDVVNATQFVDAAWLNETHHRKAPDQNFNNYQDGRIASWNVTNRRNKGRKQHKVKLWNATVLDNEFQRYIHELTSATKFLDSSFLNESRTNVLHTNNTYPDMQFGKDWFGSWNETMPNANGLDTGYEKYIADILNASRIFDEESLKEDRWDGDKESLIEYRNVTSFHPTFVNSGASVSMKYDNDGVKETNKVEGKFLLGSSDASTKRANTSDFGEATDSEVVRAAPRLHVNMTLHSTGAVEADNILRLAKLEDPSHRGSASSHIPFEYVLKKRSILHGASRYLSDMEPMNGVHSYQLEAKNHSIVLRTSKNRAIMQTEGIMKVPERNRTEKFVSLSSRTHAIENDGHRKLKTYERTTISRKHGRCKYARCVRGTEDSQDDLDWQAEDFGSKQTRALDDRERRSNLELKTVNADNVFMKKAGREKADIKLKALGFESDGGGDMSKKLITSMRRKPSFRTKVKPGESFIYDNVDVNHMNVAIPGQGTFKASTKDGKPLFSDDNIITSGCNPLAPGCKVDETKLEDEVVDTPEVNRPIAVCDCLSKKHIPQFCRRICENLVPLQDAAMTMFTTQKVTNTHSHDQHFELSNVGVCKNGGTPFGLVSEIRCLCPEEFFGKHCESQNYCSPNPCMNGGWCEIIQTLPRYRCMCKKSNFGLNCERANPCEPNPCKNYGHCAHDGEVVSCQCTSRYIGGRCEGLNTCFPNPCLNGGRCSNREDQGTFACDCPNGFKGSLCQEKSRCASHPCLNGGICQEAPDDFACLCPVGFKGKTCTNKICSPNPCENGGTCVERKGDFECLCSRWTIGKRCEDVSPCKLSPCKNGGLCIDSTSRSGWPLRSTQYYCQCNPPFSGQHCEVVCPVQL